MQIFEAIRSDHEIQRELLEQLVDTSGDSRERNNVFKTLKKELKVHADVEERHFYIPLIDSDYTQDKARHSIAEHHTIDELIETLEKTEMSSPGWLTYAKQLKEAVEHHLKEEEHALFQMAGKVFSEEQKTSLVKPYLQGMEKGRNS